MKIGSPRRSRDQVADRDVDDRQVDGGDRDPALAVDRARDPEPDRLGLRAAPRAPRAARASSVVEQLVDRSRRASARWRGGGPAARRRRPRRAIFVPPRSTPIAALTSGGAQAGVRAGHEVLIAHDGRPTTSASAREPPEQPDYNVYRSRPRLLRPAPQARPRRPARPAASAASGRREAAEARRARPASARPWRRVLKWVGIAALAWIALSFLAFAISAQIQKSKLADGVADDARRQPVHARAARRRSWCSAPTCARAPSRGPRRPSPRTASRRSTSGRPTDGSCKNPPYRSDTIMLIRAGGGTFRKLSIPRDTLAEIPGQGAAEDQLRLRVGGAKLDDPDGRGASSGSTSTRSRSSTSTAFADFIDTIGGIDVDLADRRLLEVSAARTAASTSSSRRARTTLDGYQALTLARTRIEQPAGDGRVRRGDDLDRAAVPAADPRRDQGQADQHHRAARSTSSRAR